MYEVLYIKHCHVIIVVKSDGIKQLVDFTVSVRAVLNSKVETEE